MRKQAQRNRVEVRDVLRCRADGDKGTEVMVGRKVENDDQQPKYLQRRESRKDKQCEERKDKGGVRTVPNKKQGMEEEEQDPGPRRNGSGKREGGDPQERWYNSDETGTGK